jgi:drug/metabolite transporter (DMT)-like permease
MILAAACWGFATVMSKGLLTYFSPLTLFVIQLTASVVCLWTVLGVKRVRIPSNRLVFLSAFIGVLSPGLADGLSLVGLTMTTASMSTLIWDFQPIIIIGLALLILRERVTRSLAGYSLVATLGVVLVAGVDLKGQGNSVLVGNLITLLAVFICSNYFVLTRRIASTLDALPLVALQQTVSWVCALGIWSTGLVLGSFQNIPTVSPTVWAWAFLSGMVFYALGFWFYISGLKEMSASLAGFFINLMPIFGVTGAYLFLGERLSAIQSIGGILILFSVGCIFLTQRN